MLEATCPTCAHGVRETCPLPRAAADNAKEMPDTDPERASHVAGAVPGRPGEGVPERAEDRIDRDGQERQAEAIDRRVFTGQQARGPVTDRGLARQRR